MPDDLDKPNVDKIVLVAVLPGLFDDLPDEDRRAMTTSALPYDRGTVTATDVREASPDASTHSSVTV
jgi:hypothetical protein